MQWSRVYYKPLPKYRKKAKKGLQSLLKKMGDRKLWIQRAKRELESFKASRKEF
jgi:hypothetical protein